jgi:hypothetical protein
MLLKTAYNHGYKEGHRDGLKEVIEWINQYCENIYSNDTRDTYNLAISKKEWSKKIKEWGIVK